MIESRVLGPKTGPERRAGYQTNFPPTLTGFTIIGVTKARVFQLSVGVARIGPNNEGRVIPMFGMMNPVCNSKMGGKNFQRCLPN